MNEKDFPHLFQFFGTSFHQDWTDEADDWREVVRQYVVEAGEPYVQEVRRELSALLARGLDEKQLQQLLWFELGGHYDPVPEGSTVRAWLQDVLRALGASKA